MLHAFLFLQYFVTYVCIIRIIIYSAYTMRHGIVLSAMDSSTFNSSAMDLSTIGVGVVVLVGKCMQGS